MADFERRQLEIQLEFVHWSSAERNNFNEGSSKPKKGAQVIWVRGVAAPQVFSLELLVYNWLQSITFFSWNLSSIIYSFSCQWLLLFYALYS